jgi:hypothetical protein
MAKAPMSKANCKSNYKLVILAMLTAIGTVWILRTLLLEIPYRSDRNQLPAALTTTDTVQTYPDSARCVVFQRTKRLSSFRCVLVFVEPLAKVKNFQEL